MKLAHACILAACCTGAAAAQQGAQTTIEIRKIAVVVDRDGRGFTKTPDHVTRVSNGRFLVAESGASPVLIDSSGNFITALGRIGQGPGEFEPSAGPIRTGIGDTVFVKNAGISVFSPTFDFVRSIGNGRDPIGDFLPIAGGFVSTAPRAAPGRVLVFHVLNPKGDVVHSFGSVITTPRAGGFDTRFMLAASTPGSFWAAPYMQHRFERWGVDGTRIAVIDTIPSWYNYVPPDKFAAHRSFVRALREVDGRLWVMSSVPVPNADDIMREATGRTIVFEDGRRSRVPVERLSTTMLEVYNVQTRKLVANYHIKGYGLTILDDRHFVLYSLGTDDLPQLEIWEMRLR